MAALRLVIGKDVMSSLASRHIARLPWRGCASLSTVLAAVLAACAWLCASCQQFAGVFAVSHGSRARVVWGWRVGDCQRDPNRSMAQPAALCHLPLSVRARAKSAVQCRGLKSAVVLGSPSQGIDQKQAP